jgi:hypothetical protein
MSLRTVVFGSQTTCSCLLRNVDNGAEPVVNCELWNTFLETIVVFGLQQCYFLMVKRKIKQFRILLSKIEKK